MTIGGDMSEKKKDFIIVGKFKIYLFEDGLWIENTETEEQGQFGGPNLETTLQNLWDEHF